VTDVKEENKINIVIESNGLDGFLIIDSDKIIDCNTRFQEIFGGPTEKDIVGHKFYELSLDHQPNGKKTFELYKYPAFRQSIPNTLSFFHSVTLLIPRCFAVRVLLPLKMERADLSFSSSL